MSKDQLLSRREFLRITGLSASAAALAACSSQSPSASFPAETAQTVQPTVKGVQPTLAPSTQTEVPVTDAIFPEMVQVEAGSFQMGSDKGLDPEQPVHTVTLTEPFEIGVYAVTFDEYDRYTESLGKTPLDDRGQGRGQLPITGVDWLDAVAYCNWLSERAGLTPCYSSGGKATKCDFSADGYRLPTEAEWEYAARGGQQSQGYLYSGGDNPDEVGWYADNSGGAAHPVGEKAPNELGIYDMSGNRWEWCWDWWDEDFYASSPEMDPTGPASVPKGSFVEKVRRSGSAVEGADAMRSSYRSADQFNYPGDNGFRLVRTI